MAPVNYNLCNPLHFPPLSKQRYLKQRCNRKRKDKEDGDIGTISRIDELNDVILELILARVSPWRYLTKSKCVSKRWNSIISNPDFVCRLPHEHYPFTLLLRKVDDYYGIHRECVISEHPHFQKHKLDLDFFPTEFDWQGNRASHIVAHNDVFLSYCNLNSGKDEYCIANPLTKKYVVVPITGVEPLSRNAYPIHLVGMAGFVDGVSTVTVANNNSNEKNHGFRIVWIEEYWSTLVVQVYSSETGRWTAHNFDPFDNSSIWIGSQAITLNNKVHWPVMSSKILVIDPFHIDIVPPRLLNLPCEIDYKTAIDVCQNRLRIAQLDKEQVDGRDYPRIKVWEIQDCDDYLTTNYMVKLRLMIDITLTRSVLEREVSPITRVFPKQYSYNRNNRVICCHPNDANVVYFFYEDALYYYDAVKHRCKVVSYCTGDCNQRFVFVHPFLVP